MKNIFIIQSSFRSGKIKDNADFIRKAYIDAVNSGADIVVAPLQSLSGFNSSSFLKYESYVKEYCAEAESIIAQTKDTLLVFDIPLSVNNCTYEPLYIAAQNGKAVKGASKLEILLDNGSKLYIRQANPTHLYPEINDIKPDILILTDAHDLVLEHELYFEQTLRNAAAKVETLVYANQAGGIGNRILTGCSTVLVKNGRTRKLWPWWIAANNGISSPPERKWKDLEIIHDAIVCSIRDYFRHSGLKSAVLGLSGGIDSAVVLPLAAKALGVENTLGILMPSMYSTDHSITDAVDLAKNIGSPYKIIEINPIYQKFLEQLDPFFRNTAFGLAEENLQARVRGNLLMAISNKSGNMVLNTSNKSESACGYGTLYGDLCGGLSVLGDLYKSQVYGLANYINKDGEIIPLHCIKKAPSAELRPDQKDSDSLPDYDLIEQTLRMYLEQHLSVEEICSKLASKDAVEKIIRLLRNSSYKRLQSAPVIRISSTVLADISM